MDQNKRRALLTAVELGNLTRAAETLGYTQSGLSYLIKSLETELGFPLLVRSRTGVRPTADCLTVLPYLRDLERKLQQLEQVAADIRGLATGSVSIGVFHSISRYWLPDILQDFDAQYPGITVHIREGDQELLDHWLQEGAIDMSFSSRGSDPDHLWVQVMEDEYFVVLPQGHPLAASPEIPLAILKDTPFILTTGDFDLPALFQDTGFQPSVRWSSRDELAVLSMVRAGLGISLLPGLHLQGETPGIAVRPLNPRVYRHLGVAFSRMDDLSPAARRFLVSAKKTMGIE